MRELSEKQQQDLSQKQMNFYNTFLKGNKVYEDRFNELYLMMGNIATSEIRDEILRAGVNNSTVKELEDIRKVNDEGFKRLMENMFMETYTDINFQKYLKFMSLHNWTIESLCARHINNPIHSFNRIVSVRAN